MTLMELMPVLIQAGFKLTLAFTGMIGARVMLTWFDSHSDKFKEVVSEFSPDGKAKYYGLRFVGVCLLVGLVLS